MVKNYFAFSAGKLIFDENELPCALGKGGLKPFQDKHEGDGASPIGSWPIRYVYYRPDRLDRPDTQLDVRALMPDDGWCDDPEHPLYNQPVKLPFEASHEKLWRDDHVYDIIVVLGHNDAPIIKNKGSAIFLHIARENADGGFEPTEGCVALRREHVLLLLKEAEKETYVSIAP